MLISAGTCTSDLLLAFLAFYLFKGQTEVNILPEYKLAGSLILAGFGVFQWMQKTKFTAYHMQDEKFMIKYFIKGIFLNLGNPLNIVSWLTISVILRSFKLNRNIEVLHLLGIILVVFAIESVLALNVYRFRERFTPKHIHRLRLFMGFVFFGAALKLFSTLPLAQFF